MGRVTDLDKLFDGFQNYLESGGNAAATARDTGVGEATVRSYARRYGWDARLTRYQKVIHDQIEAAHTVSVEGSIADLIEIKAALKSGLLNRKRLRKGASANMIKQLLDIDRRILELKGLLPGGANPETLPEQKVKRLAKLFLGAFGAFLEHIPGADTYVAAHFDELLAEIDEIVEGAL